MNPRPRVLHLGLGRFHRAHQAWYFQRLNEILLKEDHAPWLISSWSMRSAEASDLLESHKHRYTHLTVQGDRIQPMEITSITECGFIGTELDRFISRLIDDELEMITLTVTEKGYSLNSSGELDLQNPAILRDLANPSKPQSAIGLLAFGLEKRISLQHSPLTIVSCDNLSRNGDKLENALLTYLRALGKNQIADQLLHNVSFPNSMVDRIVPAMNSHTDDPSSVVTEGFSQWVIEDRFTGLRPPLDRVGVTFCPNVTAFEDQKLRLLNAAHSLLAYEGLLKGHAYVHEAIADKSIARLVSSLWNEVIPLLKEFPQKHYVTYTESLTERFRNPKLPHALKQIAMDGSQKISQRIFPSLIAAIQGDSKYEALERTLAAWLCYVYLGTIRQKWIVEDSIAEDFKKGLTSPEPHFQNLLKMPVFHPLSEFPSVLAEISAAAEDLLTKTSSI